MTTATTEVAVVGAGFAGLAAAQVLGRAQRDVLVLGSGPTRNAEAEHAHNVLTRDGTPPAELLRLGREEVEALPTVRVEAAHVVAITPRDGGGYRLRLGDDREVEAQVVVLATGARDALPEIPGLPAIWGRRAHTCPFCDGEQYAGRRLLVLAEEAGGAMKRTLLSSWTDKITVVDPDAVTALEEVDGDVVAHLDDGSSVTADGVFVGATPLPRLDAVADLPLPRRGPFLAVDGDGRTPLPGLWAVGDCAWFDGEGTAGGMVVAAMAAAARAGAWIVMDLVGIKPPEPPPVEKPRTGAAV